AARRSKHDQKQPERNHVGVDRTGKHLAKPRRSVDARVLRGVTEPEADERQEHPDGRPGAEPAPSKHGPQHSRAHRSVSGTRADDRCATVAGLATNWGVAKR